MGLLGWAWTWLSVPSRQGSLGKGPLLGRLPWGGWPIVSQRQEKGELEFSGVARASLCNGSRRCRDKPRVTR